MEQIVLELLSTPSPWLAYLAALAILIACGLGMPIPEDLVLFTMGYLSYLGVVDLMPSILLCLVGVLAGDCVVYGLGRRWGETLINHRFLAKLLHAERLGRARGLFQRWGTRVIFGARFMPGLRAPVFFSAGALGLPFRVFFLLDAAAALISVPLLVWITWRFGSHVDQAIQVAKQVQLGVVALILGLLAAVLLNHRLRRSR